MLNMTDDKTSESSRIVNHLDLELCHLDRVIIRTVKMLLNTKKVSLYIIGIYFPFGWFWLIDWLVGWCLTPTLGIFQLYGLFIRTVLSFIFNLHHARTSFIICNEIYFRYYTNISQLHQPKVYGLATTNDMATFRNIYFISINGYLFLT